MQPVARSVAKTYTPSTPTAQHAAQEFIVRHESWAKERAQALQNLSNFIKDRVGQSASGFVSRDPLQMTAYGLVFERNPGAGFIPVPSAIAQALEDQGLRGAAYIPDMKTEVGQSVMRLLNTLSRVSESRPLMRGVAGLRPVAIEEGRLVLSHAAKENGQLTVRAAAGAVSANAELTAASTAAAHVQRSTSAPRMRH